MSIWAKKREVMGTYEVSLTVEADTVAEVLETMRGLDETINRETNPGTITIYPDNPMDGVWVSAQA